MSDPGRASTRGFSLIEILVVLTIIAMLMGFTVVAVGKYREAGRVADCQARVEAMSVWASSYADRMGDFPPSRLASLGVRNANTVNEGIEAFVAALRDASYGGSRPNENWLGNTDDDTGEGLDAVDGSQALLEILDPWDSPMTYVGSTQYDTPVTYRLTDGDVQEDVEVVALRQTLTGAYHQFESFQIRSAGPDRLFDTEDDIANFQIGEQAP